MAKLNWQKLNNQQKAAKAERDFVLKDAGTVAGTNHTWRWGKKYSMKHIRQIPTSYLFWVATDWKAGKARDMADKEILRRDRLGILSDT